MKISSFRKVSRFKIIKPTKTRKIREKSIVLHELLHQTSQSIMKELIYIVKVIYRNISRWMLTKQKQKKKKEATATNRAWVSMMAQPIVPSKFQPYSLAQDAENYLMLLKRQLIEILSS